jgi:hypothetical protein
LIREPIKHRWKMRFKTLHLVLVLVVLLQAAGLPSAVSQQTGAVQPDSSKGRLIGSVLDADTRQPIAARIYVQDDQGNWLFVRSASDRGTAWPYSEQWVPMPQSIERHTTVSAHPFTIDLKPGEYQILIERGKEYLPLEERIVVPLPEPVAGDPSKGRKIEKTFLLKRWSKVAELGWYSGETHVHRRITELPNVMQAEELNVAFPVTYWTTSSDQVPNLEPSELRSQGPSPFGPREDRGYEPIWVADHQVILPRNTEYEIFSIGGRRHTLGALFILNHRTPFTQTAPPVGPIVQQARAEGGLLDLDKHNWPWSLMLVPVAEVDLFELSNNSVWRTNFGFQQAGHALPPWRDFEQESPGRLTEWGWLQFGFEMYYALLNCGFRISPSAGTASGVHPVPLGYSRVYVQTGDGFQLDAWLDGLKSGRSFVTTGPMLMARLNDQLSGHIFRFDKAADAPLIWSAEILSPDPISSVELIVNGEVEESITPELSQNAQAAWKWSGTGTFRADRSGWAAIRAWSDQPDGRKRFAHTGPWYFEVDRQPVRPPRIQIDYLLEQLEISLKKHRTVLSPEAIAEFEQARRAYRSIQAGATVDASAQRRPASSVEDERFWLENMAIWHQYSLAEMSTVLGKSAEEIGKLLQKYQLLERDKQASPPDGRLAVLPYPGGRHPRRGFLDGAIDPQRETKFSLFTPWDQPSYVVADVPEAIFSNLGLIYLAHTHIPTLWDQQGLELPVQEWQRLEQGVLRSSRRLPNGIRFDVFVEPQQDHVRMELALFNGTSETLSGLRVQHCMMLDHAREFQLGSNDNKVFHQDYALVHNPDGDRWLITSWKPLGRAWGNPDVPCLHADPVLPDCSPGRTTRAVGWLSFYEGRDWKAEIERIEQRRWWEISD